MKKNTSSIRVPPSTRMRLKKFKESEFEPDRVTLDRILDFYEKETKKQ